MKRIMLIMFAMTVLIASAGYAAKKDRTDTVLESERDIPVAYDVDVVVVGGTTRGVEAAVEAAKNGAKVFLAAPRPYLGEDMCATYRIWLEDGQVPSTDLAKKIFSPAATDKPLMPSLPFTYKADIESSKTHKDNGSLLSDGKASNSAQESVQYDGDVTIIADLETVQKIKSASVIAYQRNGGFEVADIEVSVSKDNSSWSTPVKALNPDLNKGTFEESGIPVTAVLDSEARYVKFFVHKTGSVSRMLLGELVIEPVTQIQSSAPKSEYNTPSPMHIKRMLDQALLDAKVDFLYSSMVTEILNDKDGNPAGIVMANRSGRQAVKAKVIIDATHRAVAARLAGAEFTDYPKGAQSFKRLVLGGEPAEGAKARKLDVTFTIQRKNVPVFEYDLNMPMKDGSFASFANAEQKARNITWQVGQVAASEVMFQVPPDHVNGSGDQDSLKAYIPKGIERIYVLGPCADVSRDTAAGIAGPVNGMELGQKIGKMAAEAAKSIKAVALQDISVAGTDKGVAKKGEFREIFRGIRSPADGNMKTIKSPKRGVPVIGHYDVVVIGGGTGGAPAGIGSARRGAKTLVVEYLNGLGGVGTTGLIATYYHGNVVGFTSEIDAGVGGGRSWNIEKKIDWFNRENDKAGADIWYGALGCGALVDGHRVIGVVVATPSGRGVVMCNTVVDATGNAVIAANAGAECMEIGGDNISVQGTGLPPLVPGKAYQNSDWTFNDDDDVLDMWRMFIIGKDKFQTAFDLGQLIDTRARRRIIGDYVMMPMDIYNKRTFPDTIVISKSNFDNHGFSSHDLFMITPPDHAGQVANVPFRCLTPKGLDGILVTGLGASAHGDSMPVLRMQPDVQNQGYAAGVAAAMAAEKGVAVRNIDIKALQKHLVEIGNLPESVLTDKDSYPLSPDVVKESVESAGTDYTGVSVILAQPAEAIPLMRDAMAHTEVYERKLRYAHILGMLGNPAGADILCRAVQSSEWDKGWNFRGMGQFGATTSPVDNLIIALGRTKEKKGLDAIVEKLDALTQQSEFSHCRAVAMALESLGDSRAAKPLARLLKEPGIMGYAFTDINDARARTPSDINDNSTRNNSLREIVLARALFRCGDSEGLGEKILRQYSQDLRGHYAKHASSVLAAKPTAY